MHFTVALPEGMNDVEIAHRAAKRSLWLWPLSPFYLGEPARQGFLLGFAGLASDEIPQAVRSLKQFMRERT